MSSLPKGKEPILPAVLSSGWRQKHLGSGVFLDRNTEADLYSVTAEIAERGGFVLIQSPRHPERVWLEDPDGPQASPDVGDAGAKHTVYRRLRAYWRTQYRQDLEEQEVFELLSLNDDGLVIHHECLAKALSRMGAVLDAWVRVGVAWARHPTVEDQEARRWDYADEANEVWESAMEYLAGGGSLPNEPRGPQPVNLGLQASWGLAERVYEAEVATQRVVNEAAKALRRQTIADEHASGQLPRAGSTGEGSGEER